MDTMVNQSASKHQTSLKQAEYRASRSGIAELGAELNICVNASEGYLSGEWGDYPFSEGKSSEVESFWRRKLSV